MRIEIGAILDELKEAWLMAVIMASTQENAKLMVVGQTQLVNWWRYGLEILIQTTHQDIERVPYGIEVQGENSLKVITKDHRSNCYLCN